MPVLAQALTVQGKPLKGYQRMAVVDLTPIEHGEGLCAGHLMYQDILVLCCQPFYGPVVCARRLSDKQANLLRAGARAGIKSGNGFEPV